MQLMLNREVVNVNRISLDLILIGILALCVLTGIKDLFWE